MIEYTYCPLCGGKLVRKKIENRERIACPDDRCGFVHWNNPVPVIAAVIEHNGSVLLARNRAWPEKMFGLVTGFLERNESPEDGIVREVKEELGLESKAEGLIGIYPFFQMNQVIMAYHVTAWGDVRLGEEIVEVKWIPPDKVRPWPYATGLAVRDWLEMRKKNNP